MFNKNIKNPIMLLLGVMILNCLFSMKIFAADDSTTSDRIIVSLGDSYSSGEGIEPFWGQDLPTYVKVKNEDWIAHRSENAWSGMLSLQPLEGTMSDYKGTIRMDPALPKINNTIGYTENKHWYFAAASGATTINIAGKNINGNNVDGSFKKSYCKKQSSRNQLDIKGTIFLPPQIEVFEELAKEGKKADYVTITIGGNDVDFVGAVEAAVRSSTYLSPAHLADKINNSWKKFYEDGVKEDICNVYEQIHEAAGQQAQILVVGYPKLFEKSGCILPVNDNAVQELNKAVVRFNNEIQLIVKNYRTKYKYNNIWFVPVENAFNGHGAYAHDPYLNGIIIGSQSEDIDDNSMISAYSMHPNYKGACAYAECVQKKIDELEGVASESSNIHYNTDLELSVYDINNNLYDDYTIEITGTYKTGWFGWFKQDYYKRFVVNHSKSQFIALNSNGSYVITVTDNKDTTKSFSKNIEVSEEYVNKRAVFSTNFGSQLEMDEYHYNEYIMPDNLNIPADAVEFNGHRYKVIQDDSITDWDDAKKYCEAQGGYLATITSPGENDFVYSYMVSEGYESAYLGLSDAETEGEWKWCNGEIVVYTNWNSGQPNKENANEDYAMFYYKYMDGTWNDGDFGKNTGTAFICEWGDIELKSEKDSGQDSNYDEREIVLVLDKSGSMSGAPLEETKKAAINFVEKILGEQASIGVVTYDDLPYCDSGISINKYGLVDSISSIDSGGGTNIEAGLSEADFMLRYSNAKKKIIVLMSDGEPNQGKVGDELIVLADEIKKSGVLIYTLGFFENLGGGKSSAQALMEKIASDGCHYEVASADDLVFFFEDMADQINGQKYIYIRIACPVDVSVTYKGETLSSEDDNLNLRTDFGTLSFEENEEAGEVNDDRIKVLRLKEGTDYNLKIVGTGRGLMDYTIGFMDDEGNYSDFRRFEDVKITKRTVIDTVAETSKTSTLNIDEDGDGKYDFQLKAEENGYGEEVKTNYLLIAAVGGSIIVLILVVLYIAVIKKEKGIMKRNG